MSCTVSPQLVLFDRNREQQARDRGIERASQPPSRRIWLERAKAIALELAHLYGEVHADDVQRVLAMRFEDVSQRAGSHGNKLQIWRLRV